MPLAGGTPSVVYASTTPGEYEALHIAIDSQKLYFEWRKPKEKEPSTYVVSREGGDPRKLSDDEIKNIPAANGRWDEAHRRVIFVDGGDIVMVDIAGTRRQITRTTGNEANPRWARRESAVGVGDVTSIPSQSGVG